MHHWLSLSRRSFCRVPAGAMTFRGYSSGHQDIPSPFRGTVAYGEWTRQGFGRPGYPKTNVTRKPGIDLSLQERLDELYAAEREAYRNRRDIGFPKQKIDNIWTNRKKMIEWQKEKRANPELERAARLRTLQVDLEDVKREHISSGAIFNDIRNAADLYGIYEDLFGKDVIFTPNVNMEIAFDFDDEYETPVYRGNIIKPSEAKSSPRVTFDSQSDDLYTLVLSNPDGHFTYENCEYLHWMVGNIKGNDLSSGQTLCSYMQPFSPYGTGFHRFVFVLYKQKSQIDFSSEQRPENCTDLSQRTFQTSSFFNANQDTLTPCGLAFFQSDWDSSLTKFYHDVLNMMEPRYEYHFVEPYTKTWDRLYMQNYRVPFNLFLDQHRDPKEIQEEVVTKKLKLHHPFKGDLDKDIKHKNAHTIDPDLPSWRRREIERERLRWGYYKDLDWEHLRRDPTNA